MIAKSSSVRGTSTKATMETQDDCLKQLYGVEGLGLGAEIARMRANNDIFWDLFGAVLVFMMQAGFTMLEAGSVRKAAVSSILLKNTMDACISGVLWFCLGYPLSQGTDLFGIVGSSWESISGCARYSDWIFGWAFAATASTIVSGAVAERCRFSAYIVYTTILTGLIYPLVSHWAWHPDGWLKNLPGGGYHDLGGSGVVHITGGSAALVGAVIIGPRVGRFPPSGGVVDLPGSSAIMATIGTLLLWFGWYAFNATSTRTYGDMYTASRVFVTTTVSAATAGCVSTSLHQLRWKTVELGPLCNGILAGLVSISAPCGVVEPYGAAAIGAVGACVYQLASHVLILARIDEPLNASPVHLACGMWGVIAVGLFSTEGYSVGRAWGLFYGGGGTLLLNQLAGIASIAACSASISAAMFGILKATDLLRIPEEEEVQISASIYTRTFSMAGASVSSMDIDVEASKQKGSALIRANSVRNVPSVGKLLTRFSSIQLSEHSIGNRGSARKKRKAGAVAPSPV